MRSNLRASYFDFLVAIGERYFYKLFVNKFANGSKKCFLTAYYYEEQNL